MSGLIGILTAAAVVYILLTDHEKDYGCLFPIGVVAAGFLLMAAVNALGW